MSFCFEIEAFVGEKLASKTVLITEEPHLWLTNVMMKLGKSQLYKITQEGSELVAEKDPPKEPVRDTIASAKEHGAGQSVGGGGFHLCDFSHLNVTLKRDWDSPPIAPVTFAVTFVGSTGGACHRPKPHPNGVLRLSGIHGLNSLLIECSF